MRSSISARQFLDQVGLEELLLRAAAESGHGRRRHLHTLAFGSCGRDLLAAAAAFIVECRSLALRGLDGRFWPVPEAIRQRKVLILTRVRPDVSGYSLPGH